MPNIEKMLQGGSPYRSNSSNNVVRKGESTRLGAILTKFVLGGLQGCTGFMYRVSLFMVDYTDILGWVWRTEIQRILPKARKVSRNEVYNTMEHLRSE
jgi:hypothetical protein